MVPSPPSVMTRSMGSVSTRPDSHFSTPGGMSGLFSWNTRVLGYLSLICLQSAVYEYDRVKAMQFTETHASSELMASETG